MKTQYLIGLILIGLFTVSIIPVTAEDPRTNKKDWYGNDIYNCWGSYGSSACQRVEIVSDQLHILIQEQNQTNNLLAYEYCKGTPTILTLDHVPTQQEMIKLKNSGEWKDNPFQDCVKQIIGETK